MPEATCLTSSFLISILFELTATGPDNDEKPKTTDVVDIGPGSADCLALHKKGLYIGGQVHVVHAFNLLQFCTL